MDGTVVAVFVFVYLGMILGRIPGLALDRTGIALLGSISRKILGLVDWQLLVLFSGLFIVNHVLTASGSLEKIMTVVRSAGINIQEPEWLFGTTVLLSNLVSNVPAVMLLLPAAVHPLAGPILALAGTLAGNMLIVGSIANIIVVEQARALDIRITWKDHARIGIPVTSITLIFAAAWLWLRASL